jgi:hypothetical protein
MMAMAVLDPGKKCTFIRSVVSEILNRIIADSRWAQEHSSNKRALDDALPPTRQGFQLDHHSSGLGTGNHSFPQRRFSDCCH